MTLELASTLVWRRERWMAFVLLASFIAGYVGFFSGPPRGVSVLLVLASWAFLVVLPHGVNVLETAAVRVDANGLHVDDHLISRSKIVSAYVEPKPTDEGSARVHVHARWGRILQIGVSDEAGGRALVEALGYGVGRARVQFRALGVSVCWVVIGLSAVLLSLLCGLHLLAGPTLLVAAAVATAVRIDVGSDGIRLSGFFRRRFIAHDAVLDVAWSNAEGVTIRLVNGKRFRFDDWALPFIEPTCAIAERIREAKAAYAMADAPDEPALLRGDAPVAAWLGRVRTLRNGDGYRAAAIDADDLLRIAQSPSAAPETRVAAVLAVATSLDDAGRARIGNAAEACASPHTRIALKSALAAASTGELPSQNDELVEALRKLPSARARS